jgi:hypothetical protein
VCAKQGLTRPPLPNLLPQSDLTPRPTSPASPLSTIRRLYVTIPECVPLQCRLAVKPGLFRSWSALLLLITAPHRWCTDKESGMPAIKAGIRNMLTTHGPSSHRRNTSAVLTHLEILVISVYLPKGTFLVTNF